MDRRPALGVLLFSCFLYSDRFLYRKPQHSVRETPRLVLETPAGEYRKPQGKLQGLWIVRVEACEGWALTVRLMHWGFRYGPIYQLGTGDFGTAL